MSSLFCCCFYIRSRKCQQSYCSHVELPEFLIYHVNIYANTQVSSLHSKSMFILDSDPDSYSTAAEIFQCRRFVTYFRCVFTPGRQCQSICIIYHHLQRSLAVTNYLDCGSICHCRATEMRLLYLQWCLYVWLLSSKILLKYLHLFTLWEWWSGNSVLQAMDNI